MVLLFLCQPESDNAATALLLLLLLLLPFLPLPRQWQTTKTLPLLPVTL